MADKTITCKDCNNDFIFNESEQAFYKEKGFENEPQRCPDCRAAKKQQMGNRGGSSSGVFYQIWHNINVHCPHYLMSN